jgi:glycosyltransferase involved in cell wall biosynthesis
LDSAITKLMFGLQQTLRSLRYESEIFVEQRDPELADRVFQGSDLPSRGNYALIIHQSPDHDDFDRLAALPARKILMYDRLASPERHADGQDSADREEDTALDQLPRSPQRVRIAWVSTWEVRCGIAEHSKSLLQPLIDRSDTSIADLRILCDDRTPFFELSRWVRAVPCWNGIEPGMERLCREVSMSDADVVVIQHQPGLIKWDGLVELLNDTRVRHRAIVVALHATRRLLDLEPDECAVVVNALNGVSKVLVHCTADVDLLKRYGLASNVTLFPLGADAQYCLPLVRALREKDRIAIGCYGFFLPGKGISRLIEAFAILRKTWPKLRLQLTNADYAEISRTEIKRCRDLASKLGVLDAIEWDTTFYTHEQSMLKLAQCDLIVLPYNDSRESASAALHSAMASGVPIAVTPISIFDDAGAAVFRFDGMDVSSVAWGIDALLRDTDLRAKIQLAATQWLIERNWSKLSRRHRDMLIGLAPLATPIAGESDLTRARRGADIRVR